MNIILFIKTLKNFKKKKSDFFSIFIKNKLTKYILIGFSGFLLQIFLNQFLLFITKLNFEISLLISIFVASNWNFLFLNKIYFKNRQLSGKNFIFGLLKFYFTSFISLMLVYFFSVSFYNYLNINIFLSQLFGLSIVVVFNYLIYTIFIWNSKN